MRLGARIRQGGGAAAISSGQHALQEVLPDRLRRTVRQMSAKPKNRDRDLPMDLQETRGDVQVAHRPARGAGTLSRGFGFFFMMASERRDSRGRFHRNLYGDTPSSVVRAKIISNFVTADVRKDCGGHIESVFALSLTENVAVFNM